MSNPLEQAPDNLPGDDLDNVLDENGAVVGRADDTLMSPERAAHLRMMREVDGNYRDMQRGHFMKRG